MLRERGGACGPGVRADPARRNGVRIRAAVSAARGGGVTVPDRETIRVERDGALARITIDRPERFNSLEKRAAHFQGR